MRIQILFLVILLTACSSRPIEKTAEEVKNYPSSGEITLVSPKHAITRVSLSYYSASKRTMNVNVKAENLSGHIINLPKIPDYRLFGIYINLHSELIFLGTDYDDCLNIKGKPVLLKSYGNGYSIPVIMLPNINDPNLCIDNQKMSGGHTY
ncbi:hypothetical protein [Hafnia alvei]|uniref:hypothetical protein n=1 Tax=Hafnia alvei TaxID=569 RepID=UPI001033DEFA|nr:hypothetical protein [Hafnia alvei]TBL90128.1 hypothetical protein EYY88_01315 [Hafnia alvei]